MPRGLGSVWRMFLDLHSSRTAGMGANPITYEQIDAYCRLQGIDPTPMTVQLLRRLDDVWREVSEGNRKRERDA